MQCVYRFVDLKDDVVKYIGIVFGKNRTLKQRTYEHARYDKWCNNSSWRVDYIEVCNRAEAESLESHFITAFNTGAYFNTSKENWGINSFLSNIQFQWKEYCKVYGKEIRCESKSLEDFPLKFKRIGISTWWHIEDGFNESIVFGRHDDDGRIYMSDGSIIDCHTVGTVYTDSDWILEHYTGDRSMITKGKCRDRKFNNIDLIAYCYEEDNTKRLKSLMLDLAISRYSNDCDMRKKQYEQAYERYQETNKMLNELVTLARTIQ